MHARTHTQRRVPTSARACVQPYTRMHTYTQPREHTGRKHGTHTHAHGGATSSPALQCHPHAIWPSRQWARLCNIATSAPTVQFGHPGSMTAYATWPSRQYGRLCNMAIRAMWLPMQYVHIGTGCARSVPQEELSRHMVRLRACVRACVRVRVRACARACNTWNTVLGGMCTIGSLLPGGKEYAHARQKKTHTHAPRTTCHTPHTSPRHRIRRAHMRARYAECMSLRTT